MAVAEHDWSEFSDHCTECGMSRYDAEGVRCRPSTDDSAQARADLAAQVRKLSTCCVRTISTYWEMVRFSAFARRSICFFSAGSMRADKPIFRFFVGFFDGGMDTSLTLTYSLYEAIYHTSSYGGNQ